MIFDPTPFVRLLANRRMTRLAMQDPAETQRQQLLGLVRKAEDTLFGKNHDFAGIRTVDDFQRRVPLRRYEQIWQEYWKPAFPKLNNCTWPGTIEYFAVSSGTSSGTTKYIPCSKEMIASNTKAGLDLLTYHLTARPNSKLFGGKSFVLGGSTDLTSPMPGVYYGDLSGIAAKTLPWWARSSYFPPPQLALMKNWEEKIDVLSKLSLSQDIRMISGVPAWLLIFFDALVKLAPNGAERIPEIYRNLELVVHGGVNFEPYIDRFRHILDGGHAELREVYPASEGFIAVADRGSGEGLRMVVDHGIFYEFVPLEELESERPTRHWLSNVETGVNYAIVLTTCAGLWSYVIGDTVRFIERTPPRLLVTGRTSYYLSAFGEHLIAEEVEAGVTEATREIGREVTDFSVGALFPTTSDELGGHLFLVEFSGDSPNEAQIAAFSAKLDATMCERNEDYEAHRSKGFGLKPPTIQIVRPGGFAAWMKSRGKLGGQNKVPRIIADTKLFAEARTFLSNY